jgi:hypothetical protein
MQPFTYERVREFTGKVQYRVDSSEVVKVGGRTYRRGEVGEVKKAAHAYGMVATGNFAHVPADTPLGVPKAPSKDAPTEPLAPPSPTVTELQTEIEEN